ncbi:MAG: zinc transport system substrate-binding protein [Myxococcota bacterium]|jgi:zinc transport system substrate-binding protein
MPPTVTLTPLLMLAFGCGSNAPEPPPPPPASQDAAPLQVTSTSFPADWLVERIAGDLVRRVNIHPEGEDPASWQPPASVVASLADADLVVANGAGFEAWMATASLPADSVVRTASKLELIAIEEVTHSHGTGEHSHAGTDPHTWGDPTSFFVQARSAHAALVAADPDHRVEFDENLRGLERDLKHLTGRLAGATAHLGDASLSANHPSFGYFARRFRLTIHPFDLDPAEPPSAEQLAAFAEWAKGKDRPVLLWESQPSDPVKAAFPPAVVHQYLDPLESPVEGVYDYMAQAEANAGRLEALLAPPAE